jgi:hypothetical protein
MRRFVTVLASLILVTVWSGTTLTWAATTPVVTLQLSGVACDPGGVAGIRATGSATAAGTSIRSSQILAFEFQPISDPAYAPFTWTGGSVATWIDEGNFKQTVTSDTRSIDTTNPTMWDKGNYSKGIWFGSKADSWWLLLYNVSTGTTRGFPSTSSVEWYVSCPTGRIVDAATLLPIDQAPMPRP